LTNNLGDLASWRFAVVAFSRSRLLQIPNAIALPRPRSDAEVGLLASWEERLGEVRQVKIAQAARTLTLGASRFVARPLPL
jgi:hypothetical protein